MKKPCLLLLFVLSLIQWDITAQGLYATQGEDIAFGGYDLTSYFEGKPILGKSDHSYTFEGLNLRFTSQENLKRFKADPEKYMPALGGWCATALVYDKLVEPNYQYFKIQDDQLLFFEVRGFFNGLTQWEKDADYNAVVAGAAYKAKLEDEDNQSDQSDQ